VWALGITSLLTDVSSEMVSSILPVYLVLYLGMSPLAFGVVDGLYQGAAALVRIAGGILADRWRRHKELAALGYGLSAACRRLIFVAGNAWTAIAGIIAIDRIGKGIRTAPRDALISQRTPSHSLATAFGVHRSLDAAGAMLGPVLTFRDPRDHSWRI
jgi:nitrate/nitrite transporter NarK